MKCFVNCIKVKYTFQDGNEVQGIELNFAPKVKKFIQCSVDNLELMRIMGNGIGDWYRHAQFGDNIILSANWDKDKTYFPTDSDDAEPAEVE